ncbi:MAG: membrane protein insertase YidC [Campylobacterales bacterium]
MQQRVLLATFLSIIVFIVYDFIFLPDRATTPSSSVASTEQSQHSVSRESAPASVAAAPANTRPVIAKIATPEAVFEIDSLGRIAQVTLHNSKLAGAGGSALPLFKGDAPRPLEIRFIDPILNEEAYKVAYKASTSQLVVGPGGSGEVVLTQDLNGTTITKRLTFYADGHYDLKMSVSSAERYYMALGGRPDVLADALTFHGIVLANTDDKVTMIDDGDQKSDEPFAGMRLLGASDRYYANLFFNKEGGLKGLVSRDTNDNPLIYLDGLKEMAFIGYIGPKEVARVAAIDPKLTDIVEYGFFTFIAKPIFAGLAWIEREVGNWGWAIVVMTIIIRLVLFPLTYRGMVSMSKIKELAPKLQEIREKYKGDPQKLNIHVMELYQKHKVNPLGGCLPILLQIPIFFAIYRVLLNAIELKGAPWIFWIDDLSAMDPYFILPILMGLTMYIQQKITPTSFTDPMQEKVFMWLPVIFTFFFVTFPAGLTLYWFVNNLFSIVQQYGINKMMERQKKRSGA